MRWLAVGFESPIQVAEIDDRVHLLVRRLTRKKYEITLCSCKDLEFTSQNLHERPHDLYEIVGRGPHQIYHRNLMAAANGRLLKDLKTLYHDPEKIRKSQYELSKALYDVKTHVIRFPRFNGSKEIFAPFMELADGRLCEQAFDGQDVYFLIYDPETNTVQKKDEIQLEDSTLKPIDSDEVRQYTVLLPSDVQEYESEEKLNQEIKDFLNKWHESPDQLSRLLDIFYCFLSYIKDLIPQLPYRRYLAPWGRGKSAWLEALGWICYRGMILAGSDTTKSVVRKMNNWRGTALIDEADFAESSFYAFITKILNIGYDRKSGYYHRSHENDPNKTLSYAVYGPKLLATRAKYKDLALESRCLTTIGRQNIKPMPLFRMDKFQQEALTLRNKLILWRFRNYHRIKESAKQLEDPKISDVVYNGAHNISSRVKQVILPLWLIGGPSMKNTLTNLAKTFDNRLKIEDPNYLLEIQAKDAVRRIIKERVNMVHVLNILYDGVSKEKLYEITLSEISKNVLRLRGFQDEEITLKNTTSTSKRLTKVFETTLGFSIRIGRARRRVVLIPSTWLETEQKPQNLDQFFDNNPIIKHVQDVHHVHPQEDTEIIIDEG